MRVSATRAGAMSQGKQYAPARDPGRQDGGFRLTDPRPAFRTFQAADSAQTRGTMISRSTGRLPTRWLSKISSMSSTVFGVYQMPCG